MTRRTKQDLLNEGIKILSADGAGNLTIDALVSRLGITKGSFYHHFHNYQAYKESLLAFFETEGTHRIIEKVEEMPGAAQKIIRLLALPLDDPPHLEVAIRAWALQDETVRVYQERIDQQRITYVQQLCLALTTNDLQAETMSQMLYAILVGSQHILPPIREAALKRLFDEFLRLYHIEEGV